MAGTFLVQAAVFLAASAIAAPLGKQLRIGSVLGYLCAGILIGPFGLGLVYSVYDVENILHIAEFGVVLLLFLIGLELKPIRLWSMRSAVFGLGGAQVLLTACALSIASLLLGLPWKQALFIGLALSLSSTAFTLQTLEENGELRARHGRLAFSILLFQDLAAIPILALVPLFAETSSSSDGLSPLFAVKAIGVIIGIVVFGRFLLSRIFRAVASTGIKEAMTASALLTVVGVALIMDAVGLSAALGAFLAGALLADSEYRHEIEANIAPFEGLLLGLFFTAVGMSLNLTLLVEKPLLIVGLVAGVLIVKAVILFGLGLWQKLPVPSARRLALVTAQDGEFAFVLLAAALGAQVMGSSEAQLLAVVVTLSMMATPLMLLADDALTSHSKKQEPDFENPPEDTGHVIIAGFGRVGQIVARILRAKRIPFTALDISSEQVDFVRKFGSQIYYGDASRLDILRAAGADKAQAFVLAIDDVEGSLKTAEIVTRHFPNLPIFARARNRQHVYRLMDLGINSIRRETFLSSVDLTRDVLRGFGYLEKDISWIVDTFKSHDQEHLYEGYKESTDLEKLQLRAKRAAEELEGLFEMDAEEVPIKQSE